MLTLITCLETRHIILWHCDDLTRLYDIVV